MCAFISGRRKILYSIYIQFGIFMELVGGNYDVGYDLPIYEDEEYYSED
jgi:hypothetical protein